MIETKDFELQAQTSRNTIGEFNVNDNTALVAAGTILRGLKGTLKEIDERFGPPIKAAHAAHKSMLSLKNEIAAPFLEGERNIKTKMGKYQREQELLARAAANAEREAARKVEEDQRLEKAAALEAEGYEEEARRTLVTPMPVVAPIIEAPQKVEGVSTRKIWKFRVVDSASVPFQFLKVDEVKLGKYARAMGATAACKGVEFYEDSSVAVRV